MAIIIYLNWEHLEALVTTDKPSLVKGITTYKKVNQSDEEIMIKQELKTSTYIYNGETVFGYAQGIGNLEYIAGPRKG